MIYQSSVASDSISDINLELKSINDKKLLSTLNFSTERPFSITGHRGYNSRTKEIADSFSISSVEMINNIGYINFEYFRLVSIDFDLESSSHFTRDMYNKSLYDLLEDGEVPVSNYVRLYAFESSDLVYAGRSYDYNIQQYYDYYKLPDGWGRFSTLTVLGKIKSNSLSGKKICVEIL